jgi:DNA-binding response OmpR family regulator
LVVEDNLEMRNYLKLILKDYNVIEAENGKEGLKKLESNLVDAIITDYMMPEMNGVEFVKNIKEKSIKAPIIVLTARNDDTGKLDMLRIGIDAYYTKPFIEEELLIKLKQSIYFYEQLKAYENELSLKEKLNLADDNTFYNDLIFTINQNIVNKNFGVEQLAEEMGLSRSSLFRKTKLVLGQTPNDVIKEVRFQTAKKILIQNPSIKKKDLAEAVGIYNATYFYENLKERFNF